MLILRLQILYRICARQLGHDFTILAHNSSTKRTSPFVLSFMMFSSADMMYSEAIKLNNHGVALLSKGHFEDARHSFRDALDVIKSLLLASKDNFDYQQQDGLSVGFQWSINAPHYFADINSFVFGRALIIVSSSGYSNHGYPEESTAIIYNIALGHHLLALERNCSSLMSKALKFYDIAKEIRKRKKESTKLEGEKLVDAAILNNVGQICIESFDYDNARRCFDQLSDRLLSLNRSGFLEANDCEGFMLNLLLEEPSLAAAA